MAYLYCPYCKEDLKLNNFVYFCKNGHSIYINPAPCVSIIPIKDNKLLLSIRGIEPRKGTYDFIGGFVNVGENVEQAAMREVKEETGLTVKLDKFLGEYSETYIQDITYPICFTYTAQVISGEIKAQDDVSDLVWVDLKEINKLDLSKSFPTIKKTLDDLLKNLV